jgi:hypothetical protein
MSPVLVEDSFNIQTFQARSEGVVPVIQLSMFMKVFCKPKIAKGIAKGSKILQIKINL